MHTLDLFARIVKHSFRATTKQQFWPQACIVDREVSNKLMYDLLSGNAPCMIARVGATEANCVNNYLCVSSKEPFLKRFWDFVSDHTSTPWWNTEHFKAMEQLSGIFPPNQETAERFSKIYIQDIPLIDLLGSFQYIEKHLPFSSNIPNVHLEALYPFFTSTPWTLALQGKKVLVVHPFTESIQTQYSKRALLFSDPRILPDFELDTLQAVQTAGGGKTRFSSWFEALDFMKVEISARDFDVCILGCGAYGLPLAAHVKRMKKKAIHLGGGTQLLFGIKGKRWEQQYPEYWQFRPDQKIYTNYKTLFNEHWIYPGSSERPPSASAIEGACYW